MSDTVKCPACGETQTDLWEHDFGSREEMVVDCGECGVDYILSRRVSVDYEASAILYTIGGPAHEGGR